jgi:uncharacterized protein YhbP (UPF0306 family)
MRHSDERHATLRELACERCSAVVKVTKFSPEHTSVQWSGESVRACAEFADAAANGGQARHAPARTCASLWETIDRAVRDGRLEVRSP